MGDSMLLTSALDSHMYDNKDVKLTQVTLPKLNLNQLNNTGEIDYSVSMDVSKLSNLSHKNNMNQVDGDNNNDGSKSREVLGSPGILMKD
jgi:hypothetical protein